MPPAPRRRSTRYRRASNSPTRSPAKRGRPPFSSMRCPDSRTTSRIVPLRSKTTVPSIRFHRFHQPEFPLDCVPADPHHLGTAHDGVHGVWRASERLCVRSRDLSAREVIPAALTRGVTVDHADRPRPPGFLARGFRHDLRRCRPQRAHIRWSDAVHANRAVADLPDHAAQELRVNDRYWSVSNRTAWSDSTNARTAGSRGVISDGPTVGVVSAPLRVMLMSDRKAWAPCSFMRLSTTLSEIGRAHV